MTFIFSLSNRSSITSIMDREIKSNHPLLVVAFSFIKMNDEIQTKNENAINDRHHLVPIFGIDPWPASSYQA